MGTRNFFLHDAKIQNKKICFCIDANSDIFVSMGMWKMCIDLNSIENKDELNFVKCTLMLNWTISKTNYELNCLKISSFVIIIL